MELELNEAQQWQEHMVGPKRRYRKAPTEERTEEVVEISENSGLTKYGGSGNSENKSCEGLKTPVGHTSLPTS